MKTTNKMKLVIALLTIATISNAQDFTKNGTLKNKRLGFNVGYFGYKFNNPGVQLGLEKYLSTTSNYNVIGSLNILYYNQKETQSAIGINARIGQRYTTNFGLFLETHLGVGVQQTFYTIKTFEYNGGQATITEDKVNKTGITPNITLGLGYDCSKKLNYPVKFYLRPAFFWLYPDRNLVFQSSYALETGLVYVPNFKKK